ncbi:hypothetical protein Avbf_19086 [Armadillidium vulgare]|nr:hypothetical protein Avbf_19086 [Armadillidium vulgare]
MKTDTKIFFTGFSFCILLIMTLGQKCDKAFQSTCKDRGGLTACEKPIVYDYVFCLQPQLPYYEWPCLHVTCPLYSTFNDDCDGAQIKNITNICLIPC